MNSFLFDGWDTPLARSSSWEEQIRLLYLHDSKTDLWGIKVHVPSVLFKKLGLKAKFLVNLIGFKKCLPSRLRGATNDLAKHRFLELYQILLFPNLFLELLVLHHDLLIDSLVVGHWHHQRVIVLRFPHCLISWIEDQERLCVLWPPIH